MEIKIDSKNVDIDNALFCKMTFLYNALNKGWSIKKRKGRYIFTKNHEGKKEVYEEDYLATFISENADMSSLLD
jgi:hypothetical protein